MEATALAFLESPEARRIVAAWPEIGVAKRGQNIEPEWAALAGVSLSVLRIHRPALERLGICRPGGVVEPDAARFIQAAAMAAARVDPCAMPTTLTEPAAPAKRRPKAGVIEWPDQE